MKYIYLLYAIFISYTNFAQDSRLFGNTWYLRTLQSDDLAFIYEITDMDPEIDPFLNILEDFSFNGEGACNIFSGTYSFFPPNNLTATDFTSTTDDCGVGEQHDFELAYFYFISGDFWYDITQDGEGAVLSLGNPLGGTAVFKSYPLSTNNEFHKNGFTLYPNPVNDVLVLSSQNETKNLDIKIFNVERKLLKSQNLGFKRAVSVDVSNLSSGIYFLNVEDGRGNRSIKKFIKQ